MVSSDRTSEKRFLQELVEAVPSLRRLWEEHLSDHLGEPLPHLFMGDVTRWVLSQAGSSNEQATTGVRQVLRILDEALVTGTPQVRELISVSFIENLPPDRLQLKDILPSFGPALASDYKRYTDSWGRQN